MLQRDRIRCIYVWLYCTCLQIYSYLVIHSDISTTRVVLHSTQKTRILHHVQKSCQCIFAASCSLQINPRVCCYQIELVRLGWVIIKFLFFCLQVNKLHCFVVVFLFLFLSLKKPGGTVGKNRRYSWLVSVCFYINRFLSLFLFFFWRWNQYTTSTFRTTSGRCVPLRSCTSFLSS